MAFNQTEKQEKEYLQQVDKFCSPEIGDKPMIFEVFTTNEDEDEALKIMRNLGTTQSSLMKKAVKNAAKEVLGDKGVKSLKKIMGR